MTQQWSRLTHNDLRKRGGDRLAKFLEMVKDGDEFLTTRGVTKIKKSEYDRLKEQMDAPGFSTNIAVVKGSIVSYPYDFFKTPEFGGRGQGFGTRDEDEALTSLKKQIEERKEKEGKQSIRIRTNRKTYDIATAESTPGTPKSDFHLLDPLGKEVVWVSHKAGRLPRDVQQWGGISQRSEPKIFAHKETQKFINDLKKEYPKGLPRATTLMRKIKDDKLKNMSVYGNEFGSQLGRQNVSVLLQGPVKLVNRGSFYVFDSNVIHTNGDVLSGGYEPVFAAIYKGDRNDAGVIGTRIVIMSITGRKMTKEF